MNPITIRLPWPPRALHAHAKGHWRPKAEATRRYRADAFWAAREAGVRDGATNSILTFTYLPPDNRRRDVQNMPAMLKAAIDGIADAMDCDDRDFRPRFPDHFAAPIPGGAVIIEITEVSP